MKSFTSIEQSRQLTEILPIESADMFYLKIPNSSEVGYNYSDLPYFASLGIKDNLPCWSLVALLDILPHEIKIWDLIYDIKIYPRNNNWFMSYKNNNEEFVGTYSTFLIDACVEMIIKLNELKLLCL